MFIHAFHSGTCYMRYMEGKNLSIQYVLIYENASGYQN